MVARAALLLALSAGAPSCGASGDGNAPVVVNPERVATDHAAATQRVFGGAADPERVVATVGDARLTAGDVAVYLELHPSLTTEQAVQDLVDIHAIADDALDTPAADLRAAQARGQTIAWMQNRIWYHPDAAEPDPARVEEYLTDVRHTTLYGTPELAVVTHVLFSAEEPEQSEERARGAEVLAQRLKDALADLDRPVYGFDLLEAFERLVPEDDPNLYGMLLYHDDTLTFPYEYSGSRRWVGLDSVAPGFAEASFESPLNTVVGPVRSMYGYHVLVVEERIPADLPSEEERVAIAEARALGDLRQQRTRAAIEEVMAGARVQTFEDAIQLLAMPAEERLRRAAEAHGERFH
jgi:hypothetical protein